MGRPPRPLPEGTIEKLRTAMKKARTKSQYRRVLAIWLRAVLGMSSRDVGLALDWRPNSVRKLQTQDLREGDAVFRGTGRGGDRRPTQLSRAARRALLDHLGYLKREHNLRLTLRGLKAECEAALGHSISYSSVYRMLRRQGWQASQLDRELPREAWPPSDPAAETSPQP